jgi:hypothetical protein
MDATDMHTTTEEPLQVEFSVRFVPRLHNEDTIKRVLRWQLEEEEAGVRWQAV